MQLRIISDKRTSINTIDDVIKIAVPNLSLLEGKSYEEIIEYLFYEDETVKSFCSTTRVRDCMLYCIFKNKNVDELEKILIEERYPLFSILMNTTNHFKNSYNRLKKVDGVVTIECTKENIKEAISLAISLNKRVIIYCDDISLKEYREILNKYDSDKLKEYKIEFAYQRENTPIGIDKLYSLSVLVNTIVDNIEKYNLSELETIMYVYDIVKYRLYKKDENDYRNSRDLDRILLENNDAIVCSGYSNLVVAILNSLGIKAKPLISFEENHQRLMVNIEDDKYNINGIYVFDPTGDRRLNVDDVNYISKYDYFAMPLMRAKDSAYDEVSEVLDYSMEELIKMLNDKKNIYKSFILHNKLVDIINFMQNRQFDDTNISVVTCLMENYPLIMETYYQNELKIDDFIRILYAVRRIEYITGVINKIDLGEIREAVSDRFTKIECEKFKKRKVSKEMYFLKKLDARVKIEEYLDKNMISLMRNSNIDNIEVKRDTLNLRLVKTLRGIRYEKEREK